MAHGPTKQETIRQAVTRFILDHGLEAGDALPTEAEFAELLGVGRNALRESMKVLDALGIVEIRHGFGTYVGEAALDSLERGLRFRAERSLSSGYSSIRDVLEVRELLEVALMPRVVAAFTGDDRAALGDIVARMRERAAADEYFPDLDWRFHETLYRPLGNALVVELVRVFWQVFSDVEPELPTSRYTPAQAYRWHAEILEAIEARDADAAETAMRAHFTGINERVGG